MGVIFSVMLLWGCVARSLGRPSVAAMSIASGDAGYALAWRSGDNLSLFFTGQVAQDLNQLCARGSIGALDIRLEEHCVEQTADGRLGMLGGGLVSKLTTPCEAWVQVAVDQGYTMVALSPLERTMVCRYSGNATILLNGEEFAWSFGNQ